MRKLFTLGAITAGCLLVAGAWVYDWFTRAWWAGEPARTSDSLGMPWDWR